MINPNKTYKAKNLFKITHISPNIWHVIVEDHAGNKFEGYLDRLTKNPKRFAVGDVVAIGCRFSIMSDTWVISSIRKNNMATLVDSITKKDVIEFKSRKQA